LREPVVINVIDVLLLHGEAEENTTRQENKQNDADKGRQKHLLGQF
jgi:hypothetical protein